MREKSLDLRPFTKISTAQSIEKDLPKLLGRHTESQNPERYATVDNKQPYSRGDLQDLKYLLTLIKNAREDEAASICVRR